MIRIAVEFRVLGWGAANATLAQVETMPRSNRPMTEALLSVYRARRATSRGQKEAAADLAAITGSAPLPRSQVVSKVWEHIKKNNLQNPQNKREIMADDKLRKIFGKDSCSMFEMNKHLSRHLS